MEEAAPAVELAEDEPLLEPAEAPGVLTELPETVDEPVAEAEAEAEEDLVAEAEADREVAVRFRQLDISRTWRNCAMKRGVLLTDSDTGILANGSVGGHGSRLLGVALGRDVGRDALLVANGLDITRVGLRADDVKQTGGRSRDSEVDEAQEGDEEGEELG